MTFTNFGGSSFNRQQRLGIEKGTAANGRKSEGWAAESRSDEGNFITKRWSTWQYYTVFIADLLFTRPRQQSLNMVPELLFQERKGDGGGGQGGGKGGGKQGEKCGEGKGEKGGRGRELKGGEKGETGEGEEEEKEEEKEKEDKDEKEEKEN